MSIFLVASESDADGRSRRSIAATKKSIHKRRRPEVAATEPVATVSDRRAAPSRRDRAILVLAGVLRKGARPLRALPPFGRLVQRQNLSGQRHRICVHDHLVPFFKPSVFLNTPPHLCQPKNRYSLGPRKSVTTFGNNIQIRSNVR